MDEIKTTIPKVNLEQAILAMETAMELDRPFVFYVNMPDEYIENITNSDSVALDHIGQMRVED